MFYSIAFCIEGNSKSADLLKYNFQVTNVLYSTYV